MVFEGQGSIPKVISAFESQVKKSKQVKPGSSDYQPHLKYPIALRKIEGKKEKNQDFFHNFDSFLKNLETLSSKKFPGPFRII